MSSPAEITGRSPPKLHNSVGVLGITAGSLLLAIESYAPGRFEPTALGLLLLVVSALLAFAAIRRLQCEASVFVNLCLILSALWAGQGVIMVLMGQGAIGRDEHSTRLALAPGLVAFAPACLLLCFVGLSRAPRCSPRCRAPWPSRSRTASRSSTRAHAAAPGFGSSGVAASYLVVALVGLYYGAGRIAHYLSRGALGLPGTAGSNKQGARGGEAAARRKRVPGDANETAVAGYAACALAASVLGCRALGITAQLSGGQVPWLGAAFALQLLVSVLSFRSNDALGGVFFAFASLVSSGAGLQLGLWAWHREGGVLDGSVSLLPPPAPVVLAVLFLVASLAAADRSLAEVAVGLVLAASCVAVASDSIGFLGVASLRAAVAVFLAALAFFFVRLFNLAGGDIRIPVGQGMVTRLVCRRGGYAAVFLTADHDSAAPVLGYSRYTDAESLGHACNALAAFGMTLAAPADPAAGPLGTLVLPWVVVAGGLLQFAAGAISFSRGKTLESTAFVFYSLMWLIWGVTRYAGLAAAGERGFDLSAGVICFMVLNLFVALGAVFLSKMWFASALCFELIMVSFLLEALGALPRRYDEAVTVIFGLVSCYCFAASLSTQTLHRFALPAGKPWMQLGGPAGAAHASCPHLPSRKASSVQQIAEIMKNGGTCGVPTDTVYVLVAACNRPEAVRKAYRSKKQAEHRPMSLWISGTRQLEPVRHLFSPLLWGLMEAAWPSSVSLVIKRGEWVDSLGMGDAASLIGTPDSIAVRYPDCTVTTQLIDLVGPIAVTSANPTGEADTTHHNQVYAKLGAQVDGVLCDGPSPENIASTVVDCTKIEEGAIKFFRVGLVPKNKVLQMFEEVRARLQPLPRGGITNVGFEQGEDEDRHYHHYHHEEEDRDDALLIAGGAMREESDA
ncbi:LOW QUALITY PROTEIN: uncharacterized protein LOC133349973 [Lethenteron reissneri]|uniref:LOW QUALITY PROTEIN: uncharacterized protein LOC133349973 n=1 Tax=Lethenteron reissneri TaxID=7753 RepID=UPI002AB60BB2|nr:LOW QUALITY PROTEIN: uncharacterized protein LOC133349973 [Lethenteron reissneri]